MALIRPIPVTNTGLNIPSRGLLFSNETIVSDAKLVSVDNFNGSATITGYELNNYIGVKVYLNGNLIGSTTNTNHDIVVSGTGKLEVEAYQITAFSSTPALIFSIVS